MLHYIALLLLTAVISFSQGLNRPDTPPAPGAVEPRQLVYVSGREQYAPNIHYDVPLLEPQFQLPPYNFIQDKQPFPRVQPQLLLYPGGADPGQPFLFQPGSPPGNFLVPQPGPNVIIRDTPQRPVFVAGYPKPAHIPPIEKDAEEIPTNPAKIPPIASDRKPEKLETFNESDKNDSPKKHATEADVLAAADKTPYYNTKISTTNDLKPGQRFFILNGQSLFSNFPFYPSYSGINPNLKYQSGPAFLPQGFNQLEKQTLENNNYVPIQSLLHRNGVTGQIDSVAHNSLNAAPLPLSNKYSDNLVLLNPPTNYQEEALFRSALPLTIGQTKDIQLDKEQLKYNDNDQFGYFRYHTDDLENDAIIIDAREQDKISNTDSSDSEAESTPEKTVEPTISQAQPGAIALAGPGGVAAAAPRGNAFVGKGGVAVSSPQATAVAGPSKESPSADKNPNKQNEKKSK